MTQPRPIYMDHNATTPVDQRVLARMLPFFCEEFGNAASRSHVYGWKAEEAVEAARGQVSRLIGATAREIVFTSGATESNNLALFGVVDAYADKGAHVVVQATEHKAVLDCCVELRRRGIDVTVLPVDAHGQVDPQRLAEALTPRTVLVSIMLANNETGTVQPLAEIGRLCRDRGVLLHTDAAQAVGKIPVDVEQLGVSLLSVSGHKLYAPKGVGALYVRRKDPRVTLRPLLHGGGHERGLRSGTLNVPAIVGLGAAAALAAEEGEAEAARLTALRERLYAGLTQAVDGVHLNGHPSQRLPGTLNVSFEGVEAEAVMMGAREVALSSGSACTSADLAPSHVLRAMGVSPALAHASLRFGLGRSTTSEDVDTTVACVARAVREQRRLQGGGRAGATNA